MKKGILTLFASCAMTISSMAQAPEGFKYQAVIRDASQNTLNNQAVGMRLTIQQGIMGGTAVYTETFAATTNDYGLVNLEIGTGSTNDNFSLIDWGNGPYFMETAVDVTGGTSYVVMGNSQLMSVPYALHAKTADSIMEVDGDVTNELQTLSFTNPNLSISSGNTVDLSTLDDGDWTIFGNGIYHNSSDPRVGIGTNNPLYPLHVFPKEATYGIYSDHDATTAGAKYGIYLDFDDTYTGTANTFGARLDTYKNGGGATVHGLYAVGRNYMTSGAGDTYGLYTYGYRNSAVPASITYGVYAYAGGLAATEWAAFFSGYVFTTANYQSSDRKLKKDITPYSNALDKLLRLNTYTYHYDNDKYEFMNLPEGEQIGLIAQEVQEVFPNLTRETTQPAHIMNVEDAEDWFGPDGYTLQDDGMAAVGERTEFLSLNYTGLIPVLVEAIKEQQKMIEELKSQVNDLQNQVDHGSDK